MVDKRSNIQDQALSVLLSSQHASVAMSMGAGKTLVGLRHMDANYTDYARFLVVAPKVSIFQEWIDQANKFNLSHLVEHVKFTTYLSLHKQDHDYDVVYLDECHSLLYSHEEWLHQYKGKIVGLTGTPPKHASSEKGYMVNAYCPVKYNYTTDEAVEDNILNDYRIKVHMLPLSGQNNIQVKAKGKVFYTSEWANYRYWTGRLENATTKKMEQILRVMRMKALQGFPSKVKYAKELLWSIDDKVILFANTVEQADGFEVDSYHSKNPMSNDNLDDFKKGKINKLACVLQLNEGVNIPNLRQGIIMHAYGNERKSSQRIGRLLRLNPDETAIIHILCYRNTIDEHWVKTALEDLDQSKIEYLNT
jgi:superfamily II DNA or RNA helicase